MKNKKQSKEELSQELEWIEKHNVRLKLFALVYMILYSLCHTIPICR